MQERKETRKQFPWISQCVCRM